jgi:sialic acid synthase SpsE
VLTLADLTFLRPGTGISPARARDIVGRVLRRKVSAGEMAAEGDYQ